jgi:anti-anti-sigma factor
VTGGEPLVWTRTSDGTVVVLAGPVDRGAADILLRELRRIWETDEREIIVHLAGVTYLDSGGLRALLLAHREAVAAGRR